MKKYDLEDRTYNFARNVRLWMKTLPNNIIVQEDGKQVIRSSGSVGANYIEANESLSKKDFIYRIKVCRKEAKESRYWLKLLDETIDSSTESQRLIQEALELKKIFSSIYEKSK